MRSSTLISAVCLVATVSCARIDAPADQRAEPPNVILVMVDTLRADHMSTYGYHRETTPFIDGLASESVVFERARSQAACTFPSVNSLLTSRYAYDFYRQEAGDMGIPDSFPALAELLAEEGYRTIAVSASPIVRATGSDENPNGGFGRGFDVFDESCLWGPAECVNARAIALTQDVEEPFFLYLHYMDPHGHYAPPDNYEKVFAGPYEGHDFIAAGDHNPIADMLWADGPEFEITDGDIQHLFDLYDDEIHYFDQQLGSLAAQWQDGGLLDRSLLVVTSDHGEEFMEHGQVGHCRGVWDTLTRVPLVIRLPGGGTGRRIDEAVELIDVVPTLLDELSIEATGFEAEGTSLAEIVRGGPAPLRYAFTDQSRYRAVDDGRMQFVFDGVDFTATLFDVRADPLEQHDLFTGSHPDVDRLGEALNEWLRETGQWVNFDAALAAAKAQEEELRALGYLR